MKDQTPTPAPTGARIGINPLLASLDDVRSFVEGFDDDDNQEPGSVAAYLATLKKAETALRLAHKALDKISHLSTTQGGAVHAVSIAKDAVALLF